MKPLNRRPLPPKPQSFRLLRQHPVTVETIKYQSAADFHVLSSKRPHQGAKSHKDCLLFVFEKRYSSRFDCRPQLMKFQQRTAAHLFQDYQAPFCHATEDGFYTYLSGDRPKPLHEAVMMFKPYGGKAISPELYESWLDTLFPDRQRLEIYEWNDDWSDYFDAGKDWWGTLCWTVYDPEAKQYVVLMASETD